MTMPVIDGTKPTFTSTTYTEASTSSTLPDYVENSATQEFKNIQEGDMINLQPELT